MLFEVVFIGQITLSLVRVLSIKYHFANFKATCNQFRAVSEVLAVNQLKLTSFYQKQVDIQISKSQALQTLHHG